MCINRSQRRIYYLLLFEWCLQKLNWLVVIEDVKSRLAWTLCPAVSEGPIFRLKNAVFLILLWLMWCCINTVYMLKQCKLSDMRKYCPTLKTVFSYCFKVDNGQLVENSAEHWTVVCSNHRLALQSWHFFAAVPYIQNMLFSLKPTAWRLKTRQGTQGTGYILYKQSFNMFMLLMFSISKVTENASFPCTRCPSQI